MGAWAMIRLMLPAWLIEKVAFPLLGRAQPVENEKLLLLPQHKKKRKGEIVIAKALEWRTQLCGQVL